MFFCIRFCLAACFYNFKSSHVTRFLQDCSFITASQYYVLRQSNSAKFSKSCGLRLIEHSSLGYTGTPFSPRTCTRIVLNTRIRIVPNIQYPLCPTYVFLKNDVFPYLYPYTIPYPYPCNLITSLSACERQQSHRRK